MEKKKGSAYFAGVSMSAIIGFQYIFLKDIIEKFDGRILLLLAVRFTIALIPFLLLLRDFKIKFLFDRNVIILSLFQPCLNLIAQTYAAEIANVALIAYLTALAPIATAVTGRIIAKEKKPTALFYAYMALAIIGSALAVASGKKVNGIAWGGVALCLMSLAFRGVYSALSKKATMSISPLSLTVCQVFIGAIFYSVLAFAFGESAKLSSLLRSLSAKDYLALLYLSLLSISLAYLLNNVLLESLSVSMSGVLNNLTFLSMLASGVLFRSEAIGWPAIIGSLLIIVGVFASAAEKRKSSP